MKTQKFFRGQRVRVSSKMPLCMRHFECGCEAIVRNSYSDHYGPRDGEEEYGLLLLTEKPHHVSWYMENQLELICDNRRAGENLLQRYKGK